MKRIAILTVLVVFGAAWPIAARAQGGGTADDKPKSEKAIKNEQKALEKYQRAQQKAQQKAQRKADKKEQKAAKKYEKEQRKLLKTTSRPDKHAS